jgi:hypothetical protein
MARRWSAVVVGALAVCAACTPSTPEGVDVSPLTRLTAQATDQLVPRIKQDLGLPERHPMNPFARPGSVVFNPPDADTARLIFRSVDLLYSETINETSAEFDKYRTTFGNKEQQWLVFREAGEPPDRHFISFKGVRWETNHSIPYAVNTKPEILVAVQKNNLFISVSFTAFLGGTDYVRTMNADIQFVARVIERAAARR